MFTSSTEGTLPSGRHLFLAFSTYTGDRSTFGSWYDEVHIPQILSAQGMRGAQRFELAATKPLPGVRSLDYGHLALYEIDGDPLPFREEVKRLLLSGEMEIPQFMNPPFKTLILKPVSEVFEGAEYDPDCDLADRHLFFAFSRHTGGYEMYAEWYDEVHIPQIMSAPGMFRAQRFMQADVKPLPGVVTPDAYHLALYELRGDPLPFREGVKAMLMSGEMQIPDFMIRPFETMFMRPASPFFPAVGAPA
jgi:hypothetical protein